MKHIKGGKLFVEDIVFNDEVYKRYIHTPSYEELKNYIDEGHNDVYEVLTGKQKLYLEVVETKDIIEFIEAYFTDARVTLYSSYIKGKRTYLIMIQNYFVNDNAQQKYRIEELIKNYEKNHSPINYHTRDSSYLAIPIAKSILKGSADFYDSLIGNCSKGITLIDK